MTNTMRMTFAVLLATPLVSSLAEARKRPDPVAVSHVPQPVPHVDGFLPPDARFAIAATNTTFLASYNFEGAGSACDAQGWTVVDATAQVGTFWHVDDFAGVNVNPGDAYAPLAGARSLWCGARPAAGSPTCGYATLPGYGNGWNQTWQTKACVPVAGNLDVAFLMKIDSEANYDAVFLEYTTECGDPAPISDWDLRG